MLIKDGGLGCRFCYFKKDSRNDYRCDEILFFFFFRLIFRFIDYISIISFDCINYVHSRLKKKEKKGEIDC